MSILGEIAKLGTVFLLSSGVVGASVFSLTGTFPGDDHLEIISFTTNGGTVNIKSLGYAGGTDTAGTTIPRGGLDSNLSVFDLVGNLLVENDDGTGAPVDPATGDAFDAIISHFFIAGTYELVITETNNAPNGNSFSAGFLETGGGNYTCLSFAGSTGPFCDQSGNQRTGAWALDIVGVTTAADITQGTSNVPEPATVSLVCGGAYLFALSRRRTAISKRTQSQS